MYLTPVLKYTTSTGKSYVSKVFHLTFSVYILVLPMKYWLFCCAETIFVVKINEFVQIYNVQPIVLKPHLVDRS